MENGTHYTFRPAGLDDLAMLSRWQQNPHVSEWWGTDAPFDGNEAADPRVSRWIVGIGGSPIAYMQDYTVHGWGSHHFDYLPAGSRGIDQYIGEPQMTGLGHGSSFIRQRMSAIFAAGAPVICTDPHPRNERAIAVYEKLGFRVVGPSQETRWGVVLPMEMSRP